MSLPRRTRAPNHMGGKYLQKKSRDGEALTPEETIIANEYLIKEARRSKISRKRKKNLAISAGYEGNSWKTLDENISLIGPDDQFCNINGELEAYFQKYSWPSEGHNLETNQSDDMQLQNSAYETPHRKMSVSAEGTRNCSLFLTYPDDLADQGSANDWMGLEVVYCDITAMAATSVHAAAFNNFLRDSEDESFDPNDDTPIRFNALTPRQNATMQLQVTECENPHNKMSALSDRTRDLLSSFTRAYETASDNFPVHVCTSYNNDVNKNQFVDTTYQERYDFDLTKVHCGEAAENLMSPSILSIMDSTGFDRLAQSFSSAKTDESIDGANFCPASLLRGKMINNFCDETHFNSSMYFTGMPLIDTVSESDYDSTKRFTNEVTGGLSPGTTKKDDLCG
ncbi:uncharacterized protein V1518DRAFT_314612 [Limtongia smithiae]|uniref:uncharacterized protein n=1 Tax=Limtongia smithiae TaxID=1125753 RepID=UPI0034CDA06E